jgi:hypothetical protein
MGRRTAVVLETVQGVARRVRRFLLIRTPAWCDLRGGYQRLALAHEHRLSRHFWAILPAQLSAEPRLDHRRDPPTLLAFVHFGTHVWQPA